MRLSYRRRYLSAPPVANRCGAWAGRQRDVAGCPTLHSMAPGASFIVYHIPRPHTTGRRYNSAALLNTCTCTDHRVDGQAVYLALLLHHDVAGARGPQPPVAMKAGRGGGVKTTVWPCRQQPSPWRLLYAQYNRHPSTGNMHTTNQAHLLSIADWLRRSGDTLHWCASRRS
jgi:hypothetical protein